MKPSGSLDWFVFTKKTAAMQRISDLVRTGHSHYVAGVITFEKASQLSGKLGERYQVGMTHMQASRHRKAGFASFRLIMLDVGEENLRWWLLKTDGKTPPEAEREKWRDALKDRLIVPTHYELVRRPRPGTKTPAWTWRYSSDQYESIRDQIIHAIRARQDQNLRQLIHSIFRTPGFAAAREQVKQLTKLIKAEWRRSRGGDPLPEIPERLGYVRRLPDAGKKLSALKKERNSNDYRLHD